jgi:hypothetical protein
MEGGGLSNRKRLPRADKRKATREVVTATGSCPDCGAKAAMGRERAPGALRKEWVVDVPHDPTCPALRQPWLRDAMAAKAVAKAQGAVAFPLAYVPAGDGAPGGVVVAR